VSIHDAKGYGLGFMDGYQDRPADTRIVHSEYRKAYLEGWFAGRHKAEEEENVGIPDWVNEGGERE
jgi:hypothetical protein